MATGPSGTLASHGYSYASGSADTSLLRGATNTAGVTTTYGYNAANQLTPGHSLHWACRSCGRAGHGRVGRPRRLVLVYRISGRVEVGLVE